LNNNKVINEKLICAFRWSVLPSITHNCLYVFENWGKILSHKKDIVQLEYEGPIRSG